MKTLVLDIETMPAQVYVFDLFNQNISLAQIKEPVRVGSFVAEWLGEDRPVFYGEDQLTHEELIRRAFELFDEADAVITFNGDRFDIPHLNREFLELGLGRPSPFKSIDLYKVVKKHHKFLSRKLAHILQRLELSQKIQNDGWPLWIACLNGEEWAWQAMRTYNIGDVVATRELYYELLVWIDNHPNVQLYRPDDGRPACPLCDEAALVKRGTRKTRVSEFQRYQCSSCGGWSSDGKRLRGVDVR